MTLHRQNLANAIRQSSLGNSRKMGELLDRFVQGKLCGTPQDIEFLIDEVVKRIEKRLLQRVAQLAQTSLDQTSKEEQKVSRTKKGAADTAMVSEATIRHQACLIVEHILKTARRHFKERSSKVSTGKKPGSVGITPAKVKELASQVATGKKPESVGVTPAKVKELASQVATGKKPESVGATPAKVKELASQVAEQKSRVSTKKANTQTGGNRRATGNKPAPDQRSQVYYRFANADGQSQTTANTFALRKANKASMRRYSVSGNVKALMCAAEWATSGDMEVVTAPVGRAVVKSLPKEVELLQDAFLDNHGESDFSNFRSEVTSAESPRARAINSSSKGSSKTKGAGAFLNSSYTYARRAEIKKTLPKFLASGSRDAMMNLFDAIRLAMAEEEVENQDFDFIESLINRSQEKSSSQKARPKQRDANLPLVAENQRGVHMETSTNGGKRDRTYAAELERHESEARKDDFKEDSRSKAMSSKSTDQQDKSAIEYMGDRGFQFGTNYTYEMHRDMRRILPKYTGKRPYNALMRYADNMLEDVYREMVRTGHFVSIPENTFKQDAPVHHRPKDDVEVEEVNRSASYYKPIPLIDSAGFSVATQTSTNFGIDSSSEDSFHDVELWVPQITSELENQEIRYARIQEQREHQAQREIDEVIYQPVQGTDRDEDAFSPSAFLKENRSSTSSLGLSPSKVENNTDASQPRVRFADGMKPGEVGEESDDTMGSTFFDKLGYYERVGGGEILHKTAQRKSQKTDAAETTEKTEESIEKDRSEPQPSTQEENDADLPEREEEDQTEEQPPKPSAVEKMCNCL